MLTVLLVEPDPEVAATYTDGLVRHGYRVERVESMTEAARQVAADPPGVAVIDLKLPDGSGLDLLSRFQVLPGMPPMAAVVLADEADPDLVAKVRARGASAYLVKSKTTPADLAVTIGEIAFLQALR